MIVRITVVVTLLVAPLGGVGGDTTPGESIVPPSAETASAIVRIEMAHVRRIFFTYVAS